MELVKETCFVKGSGDVLENDEFYEWLRKLSLTGDITLCIGGTGQINRAFKNKGLDICFGKSGRIITDPEELKLATAILRKNRKKVKKKLKELDIHLKKVIIPVIKIGGVSCYVNGDLVLLCALNGYRYLYAATLIRRTIEKKEFFKKYDGPGKKINVVGFKETR